MKPQRNSNSLVLVALSLGFVVVLLDVTVVNVALKAISQSFHTNIAGLQWVVNSYTLGFASLILTAGALGDRIGAKRVFQSGFVLFTLASIACAVAGNLELLIAARALQGVGAAILVPCSLSLLNHTFTEAHERSNAVAKWAAGASLALATGPLVGGVLIAALGWRSIFFINLPVGILGIWLTQRYAEETTKSGSNGDGDRLDISGQIWIVLSLLFLSVSIIEGGEIGWSDTRVMYGFAVSAVAMVSFIVVEIRSSHPMLPPALFSNRTFSAASLIGFLINTAFYGLLFVLSLFFQRLQLFTPLQTGLAFLPMMAAIVVANLSTGRLAARVGTRGAMMAGQALLSAGCFSLITMDGKTAYLFVLAPLFCMGFGLGLVVPPMTSALLGSVERPRSGVASGVLNTLRQIGSVVGVGLFGALVSNHNDFVHGLHRSLFIAGSLALTGAAVALKIQVQATSPYETSSAPANYSQLDYE